MCYVSIALAPEPLNFGGMVVKSSCYSPFLKARNDRVKGHDDDNDDLLRVIQIRMVAYNPY